jgi:hypothetical protein
MMTLLEPPKDKIFMDNVFEKYHEPIEERPIEIMFPLNERDILKILKGVEFNQILTIGTFESKPQRIHVRVFSSDRMKHITWDNWRKILYASHNNFDLMQVIQQIESENS